MARRTPTLLHRLLHRLLHLSIMGVIGVVNRGMIAQRELAFSCLGAGNGRE
jgi:hypothetical protein